MHEATSSCESACDLTPNRLPTVTLVGHTINSSIQCVAMRGLGSDLGSDAYLMTTSQIRWRRAIVPREDQFSRARTFAV